MRAGHTLPPLRSAWGSVCLSGYGFGILSVALIIALPLAA